MIKHYVASTMPQQHNIRSANPRLDEIQIKQHMALDLEKHFSSQLVLLYYVLSHQDAAHSEHMIGSRKKLIQPYSLALMTSIPTRLLVSKAHAHRRQLGTLYPSLMKMLHSNYPHLCIAHMWLPSCEIRQTNDSLVNAFKGQLSDTDDSIHNLYLRLRYEIANPSSDPLPLLLKCIKVIQRSDENEIPRHMTQLLLSIWEEYSRIAPERLYKETVNTLRDSFTDLTEEEIIVDPLLILQSIPSCRQPEILSIMLHLMEVYTAASQRHYNVLSQTRMLPGAQALPDAQEICYSLLAAQDSATMQILLEQCLPEYEGEHTALTNERERQTLLCSYIHKKVIDQPNLAKLVCFRGYNHKLIEISMRGIPSFHICLDYIPELIAQPDIKKQAFAVRLTAALCKQYGVHKTYSMAKLCINTLVTLMGVLPTQNIERDILPLMPDVVTMCHYMPILYDDWVHLLAKLLPIISSFNGVQIGEKHNLKALAVA